MGIEENKATIRKVIDETNKGNFDVMDEYFTDNFVAYHASGFALDKRQYKQSITNLSTNKFPDMHITIEDVIAEGDRVMVRETVSGTQKEKYGNIAPTGKAITIPRLTIYRFQSEKVAELWYLSDMLAFYQQLGVLPQAEMIGK